MWNIRFLVLAILMPLKKPGRLDIQPTDLQRGSKMARFSVENPQKTYIFEFSWLRDHAEKIERLEEL